MFHPWNLGKSFREEQCEKYNSPHYLDYNGNMKQWIPKYTGVSPRDRCKLFCRARGSSEFKVFESKVTSWYQPNARQSKSKVDQLYDYIFVWTEFWQICQNDRMLHYIEELALWQITNSIHTLLQERPNICFWIKIYGSKNQRGTYYRPIYELKRMIGLWMNPTLLFHHQSCDNGTLRYC